MRWGTIFLSTIQITTHLLAQAFPRSNSASRLALEWRE
jgi:hypothetical protein